MAAHDDKEQQRQVRSQQSVADRHRALQDLGLRQLMRSPEGREFLWWLLQIGKVGLQPFTANALNTAFQCGELNVGNQILDRITETDPAVYVQMQVEHMNEHLATVADTSMVDGGGQQRPGTDSRPGGYDHPDASSD